MPTDDGPNRINDRAPVSPAVLELLSWISRRRRTYEQTMEAWRSTCPRYTVWEDALIDGLVQVESGATLFQSEVTLTAEGRAVLNPSDHSVSTEIDKPPYVVERH
jgi:hypothetical protein